MDGQGHPRETPIIVRFIGERVRDEVFRACTKLKDHNDQHRDSNIFINNDLTIQPAKLAYDQADEDREDDIGLLDCLRKGNGENSGRPGQR